MELSPNEAPAATLRIIILPPEKELKGFTGVFLPNIVAFEIQIEMGTEVCMCVKVKGRVLPLY